MKRTILYIDGFNLYYGLRDSKQKGLLWLDLWRMGERLLRPDQQLVEVKYFTSIVSGTPWDPQKPKRQKTFLEALETLPDLHIFYGTYLSKERACRKCGNQWTTFEEKMTDVNIALHLVQDAHDDRYDVALVVSADSDLAPPIELLTERYPAKRVVVAFPPGRHSNKLAAVAPAHITIRPAKLKKCLFPDEVVKADGFVLKRPQKWT